MFTITIYNYGWVCPRRSSSLSRYPRFFFYFFMIRKKKIFFWHNLKKKLTVFSKKGQLYIYILYITLETKLPATYEASIVDPNAQMLQIRTSFYTGRCFSRGPLMMRRRLKRVMLTRGTWSACHFPQTGRHVLSLVMELVCNLLNLPYKLEC